MTEVSSTFPTDPNQYSGEERFDMSNRHRVTGSQMTREPLGYFQIHGGYLNGA